MRKSLFSDCQCTLFLVIILSYLFSSPAHSKEISITSPNGKIKLEVRLTDGERAEGGSLEFRAELLSDKKYIKMLDWSRLGVNASIGDFDSNLKYVSESRLSTVKEKYEMPVGKRRFCSNEGAEKRIHLVNRLGDKLTVVFRVYNDGIAFKYEVGAGLKGPKPLQVFNEISQFSIPKPTNQWVQTYKIDYEGFYNAGATADLPQGAKIAYPALFEVEKQGYMLITEADLGRDSVASSLTVYPDANSYKVTYPEPRKNTDSAGVLTKTPWVSPWRVMIIGSLADIVQSTLVTDLSKASKIKKVDWIKPGAASWVYWANNHGSKDYQLLKNYVNLASEMNWPYTLIDWEWDAMGNGGSIEDIVSYSISRGVKPWMWYNSGTSWLTPTPVDHMVNPKKRKQAFSWLKKIGVVGVKIDFFAGDQQDVISYYIDLLEDAAKHELLVNFHGATLPRGWQRTYPNLLTVEAVYGAEWYNNVSTFTDKAAEHNATIPFTRNVVGSMDYTPVTFSNSQNPHITTSAHELALSIVFESGVQHFADRPSAYAKQPNAVKEVLRNVPVSWDETILLDGYPGKFIVIARRKNTSWYVAGINGSKGAKDMTVDLSFLGKGRRQITVIKDGEKGREFAILEKKVQLDEKVLLTVPSAGGFTIIVDNHIDL